MILFEHEFHDYKTADVQGDNVVDLHHTGMSFYDDFLSTDPATLAYLKNKKNLEGKVVLMSPEEYYQACSEFGFPNSHPSVEKLKRERQNDHKTLTHLKNVLTIYKKRFPMPILNKADNGQEGLHRMMAIGELLGWDHKVPVLIVDWADKERAFQEAKRKRVEWIQGHIRAAVQKTLRYKFSNIEELREQLQWELDRQFEHTDVDTPVQFELTTDETTQEFTVGMGAADYSFDYEDVEFIEPTEDADLDTDDLDLETIEDFLIRYFGDDWRETNPDLKDTFNIKESFDFNPSNIKKMDEYIQKEFGHDYPGEGCIFIHPNGKFINIYPKLDDHEDLCYWLEENYNVATPGDAEWFVQEFNYVRCRNSPHLTFVELTEVRATTAQLLSLKTWIEEKVSSDILEIETEQGWKSYNLDEYFPEDIIKLIKRYYSSGILYEKLN